MQVQMGAVQELFERERTSVDGHKQAQLFPQVRDSVSAGR